ncbi:DEAD/DEAH box helicase [archaeon]|nr:MAG: DEAD/DEAH box helicase [archaeon]
MSKDREEKKQKKHSKEEDHEEVEKDRKEKKRKRDRSPSADHSDSQPDIKERKEKKVKIDAPIESDHVPRRARTRSMSDAEEHFRIIPTSNPEEFRKLHQITIVGRSADESQPYDIPAPMATFDQTPFTQSIRSSLTAAGFEHATPTQAQSWPIALQGRDIITVAKTGSGKTCGFLLPAFHRLLAQTNRRKGPPGMEHQVYHTHHTPPYTSQISHLPI